MEQETKADLRRQLLRRRLALSEAVVQARSRQIVDRTLQLIPRHQVRSLHTYVPIAKKAEVNTWPLLRQVWHELRGCLVAVPLLQDNTIVSAPVTPDVNWHTDTFGIPLPETNVRLLDDQRYDVIIVPMLGFTDKGYRLGYGGGYYDKFLAGQPESLKIGLCYADGLVSFTPEAHDVPLQFIVTETTTYAF